jgi:hypothetical protein
MLRGGTAHLPGMPAGDVAPGGDRARRLQRMPGRLGGGMTHAELVDAIAAACKRRRLRCERSPNPVVRCGKCAAMLRRPGAGAGWVDLVILGRRGALFVEVKSQDGRRTMEQMTCAGDIAAAGLRYRVWRPSDLAEGRIDGELDRIT